MATWGGSTIQSVDTTGDQSGEEQYDEDYEGDTTLQHTGMFCNLYFYSNPHSIFIPKVTRQLWRSPTMEHTQ